MSDPSLKVAHPFEPELAIEVRGAVHLVTLDRPDSFDTDEHQAKMQQLRTRIGRAAG
jgi:hypothetical protein